MSKKITVRINGGLGNQLHIYAFGRAISMNNECELEVDADRGFIGDPTKREYLLDHFPLLNINRSKVLSSNKSKFLHKVKLKIGAKICKLLPLSIRPIIKEDSPRRYQKEVHYAKYAVNPYFIGLWSSDLYYQNISKQLRKELIPPKPEDKYSLQVLDKITSTKSCFIHWRSYAEDTTFSHPSYYDYYCEAINHIEIKHPNTCFYVFSDIPSKAYDELNQIKANMVFVDIQSAKGNRGSLIDFYLMYACKHAIIANSSFGWWAAWLGDNDNKTVVAPLGFNQLGRGWAPLSWTVIDS